jgi:hypothetical protein
LGLPNGLDLIIEYITAFVMGLLIFQALFMKSSMGGSYIGAIKKTFFSETVSMNMVMVGMIPVMAILRGTISGGADPEGPIFWGISSVATLAGIITAYPINSWLVGSGLKHGMMSAVTDATKPMDMSKHKAPNVSLSKKLGVVILTLCCLAIAVWITTFFVELKL